MTTLQSVHVSTTIARDPEQVYAYIHDPRNLPHWAAGLSRSQMSQEEGDWWADSPMGKVKVEFAPSNPFRVADHTVTLPDGTAVLNPMRVLPNGQGSEVIFSLFRRPEMSQQQFSEDQRAVERDLESLKKLLEA